MDANEKTRSQANGIYFLAGTSFVVWDLGENAVIRRGRFEKGVGYIARRRRDLL
jgi:hypothetical protein